MVDELLGVTTCPTCQKRFRVSKKYESFIGKEIKCPKCKHPFLVEIEKPALIEQAAMASSAITQANGQPDSTNTPVDKQKKKKRTKAEIRKSVCKRIGKDFTAFLKQLQAISTSDSYSEEKVRMWCTDVLRGVLGYDNEDLDFELSAVSKRIDIAVKHDGKVILIIECKKHNTLPKKARDQAVSYALNKSADWAVVTNGQTWELHRVIPISGKDPRVVQVFNISLLDDDGLSPYDIERMYLLTKRALLRGETEKEFHRARCLENRRLFDAMFSPRALKAMRQHLVLDYKKEFKQHVGVTVDDVEEAFKELIRPEELCGTAK